jgi:ActR/RegA family two-component response regulator
LHALERESTTMVGVKICGFTNVADAVAAVDAGATRSD